MTSIHGTKRGHLPHDAFTRQLLSKLQAGERLVAESMLQDHLEIQQDDELVVELFFREMLFYIEEDPGFDAENWLQRYPEKRERMLRLLRLYDAMGDESQVQLPTSGCKIEDTQASVKSTVAARSFGRRPAPRCETGDVIGQYEILGRINSGGMGTVYKARQLTLKRDVALKVIDRVEFSEVDRSRFQAEAETAARLTHPNIVQVFEVGKHDELAFISMELVDGGDLEARTNGRPIPARKAAQLVMRLAMAMQVGHQHGIIHRDLKPGNVLLPNLDSLEQPKIADFGLAKCNDLQNSTFRRLEFNESANGRKNIAGTPGFMAPEQARGDLSAISTAVDTYGLGAILYQCLTGRPPFQGDSVSEILEQVKNEPAATPRQLQSEIPRDLQAICLKCLAKLPAERYVTCQDLADDLKNFLERRVTVARKVSFLGRAGKWLVRQPVQAGLGLLLCMVAAVGAWGVFANHKEAIHQAGLAKESEKRALKSEHRAIENEKRAIISGEQASKSYERIFRTLLLQTRDNGSLTGLEDAEQFRYRGFQNVLILYESLLPTENESPQTWSTARQLHRELALFAMQYRESEKAAKAIKQAVKLDRLICNSDDANENDFLILAADLHTQGWIHRKLELPSKSARSFRECLQIYREWNDTHDDDRYRHAIENAKMNLVAAMNASGDLDDQGMLLEATTYFKNRFQIDPTDYSAGSEYILCLQATWEQSLQLNQLDRSLVAALTEVEVVEELSRALPNRRMDGLFARAYSDASRLTRMNEGSSDKAIALTAKALSIVESIDRAAPGNLSVQARLARFNRYLADLYIERPEYKEKARLHYKVFFSISERLFEAQPRDEYRESLYALLLKDCPLNELRNVPRAIEVCYSMKQQFPESHGPGQILVELHYANRQYVECLQEFVGLLPFGSSPITTTTAIAACTRLKSLKELREVFSARK